MKRKPPPRRKKPREEKLVKAAWGRNGQGFSWDSKAATGQDFQDYLDLVAEIQSHGENQFEIRNELFRELLQQPAIFCPKVRKIASSMGFEPAKTYQFAVLVQTLIVQGMTGNVRAAELVMDRALGRIESKVGGNVKFSVKLPEDAPDVEHDFHEARDHVIDDVTGR